MAIETDVLVIGGGLAGLMSAVSAARTGADVRLVSAKQSTLANATGLVDILGYTPDGEGPLPNPYEAIPELPADHPYKTVGTETVRAGMALFDELLPNYQGDHTEQNALVPTHGGTVKPTARYPAGVADGLASDQREMLFVGFEALTDFVAPHAADHLAAAGVPFEVAGATIQFPGDLRADAAVTRYAKLLDSDASVREALAEAVAPHLGDAERVGFPALLGDDDTAAVRADLSDRLGAAVFEVPSGPPSLPGLRLEDALFDALAETGAGIETGNPVVEFDAGRGRVEQLYVERNGANVPVTADQYVLATGGLVGKGLDSDREAVREPVFDCHIAAPEDRYDWSEPGVFGDHAFARFGVDTDESLRPLGADGETEFTNLRAAGAVLGGYDFAAEKSGGGVAVATGYAAGRAAAEETL